MEPLSVAIEVWLVVSAVVMWGVWGPWRDA